MVLPDKIYTWLKWIDLVCLPALVTAYVGLANIWSFPYPQQIAETGAIVCTLIGALIGISSTNYYKTETEKTE